jgi:hypothetical protein
MNQAAAQIDTATAAGEAPAESVLDQEVDTGSLLADGEQPQAEAQATDQTADADKADAEGEVPERYDYKVPEGYQVSEEMDTRFQGWAREQKFNPAQVQAMVDFHAELDAQAKQSFAELRADYVRQVKADPELGGANLQSTKQHAQKALQQFDKDGKLREALIETGWDNYPEMVRLLARVGKAVSEASFVTSENAGARDPAKVLYPNMN